MTHPSSTIASHTKAVYDALKKDSVDDVFTGSLVKVYDTCNISRSHYKKIFELLTDLSCITVEVRGHGSTPSRVLLHHYPAADAVEAWYLTKGPRADKTLLETRVAILERQLGGLDIKKAIQDLANQVEELQSKV
jgi:hypothetical protein